MHIARSIDFKNNKYRRLKTLPCCFWNFGILLILFYLLIFISPRLVSNVVILLFCTCRYLDLNAMWPVAIYLYTAPQFNEFIQADAFAEVYLRLLATAAQCLNRMTLYGCLHAYLHDLLALPILNTIYTLRACSYGKKLSRLARKHFD